MRPFVYRNARPLLRIALGLIVAGVVTSLVVAVPVGCVFCVVAGAIVEVVGWGLE